MKKLFVSNYYLSKNESEAVEAHSFFGVPTSQTTYTIKGAYDYIFELIDSNDLVTYAYYEDPYYFDSKWYAASYGDLYEQTLDSYTNAEDAKKIIYTYLTDDDISKIEFSSNIPQSRRDFRNYSHSLNIYLNYTTFSFTDALHAKLLFIERDSKNLITSFITFLDTPNKKDRLYTQQLADMAQKENLQLNSILYNDFIAYLRNNTKIANDDNVAKIAEKILMYSQNYILDNYKFIKNYFEEYDYYLIGIQSKTVHGSEITVVATLRFNNDLNDYICTDIELRFEKGSGSLKLFDINTKLKKTDSSAICIFFIKRYTFNQLLLMTLVATMFDICYCLLQCNSNLI